jgi:hypothetical protein
VRIILHHTLYLPLNDALNVSQIKIKGDTSPNGPEKSKKNKINIPLSVKTTILSFLGGKTASFKLTKPAVQRFVW